MTHADVHADANYRGWAIYLDRSARGWKVTAVDRRQPDSHAIITVPGEFPSKETAVMAARTAIDESNRTELTPVDIMELRRIKHTGVGSQPYLIRRLEQMGFIAVGAFPAAKVTPAGDAVLRRESVNLHENPRIDRSYHRWREMEADIERYYAKCADSPKARRLGGSKGREYCSRTAWMILRKAGRYRDYPAFRRKAEHSPYVARPSRRRAAEENCCGFENPRDEKQRALLDYRRAYFAPGAGTPAWSECLDRVSARLNQLEVPMQERNKALWHGPVHENPRALVSHVFPVGARVLVDGRNEAIVLQAFPSGSTSFLFPHYQLKYPGAPPGETFVVATSRVGVERRNPIANQPRPSFPLPPGPEKGLSAPAKAALWIGSAATIIGGSAFLISYFWPLPTERLSYKGIIFDVNKSGGTWISTFSYQNQSYAINGTSRDDVVARTHTQVDALASGT